MTDWSRFFLLRLPLAFLAVALVVEGASFALSGVTLHRHNVDDLAYAATRDHRPYRVVLLGDSVTHNVAHKFRIGGVDEVADMTTHAYAGLPSSLFLLRRYLESGHRPQQVVLAVSLTVFVEPMMKSMFDYYVQSVFTLPAEKDFLRRYYGDHVDYRWRPAALSMTTRLGEPLFSLLRHPGDQIWAAPAVAASNPALDDFPHETYDDGVFERRVADPYTVRPEVKAILGQMCELSRTYGFALHVILAPMHPRLRERLVAQGKIQHVKDQLSAIFAENHATVTIDDASDQRTYPHFDRGYMHIMGLGWEQAYATQLGAYIHGYESEARPRAD